MLGANCIIQVEYQAEWIGNIVQHMEQQGLSVVDCDPSAQEEWVDHCQSISPGTVWARCDNWYNKVCAALPRVPVLCVK